MATLQELLSLTPTQFEQRVGGLLRDLGYRQVQHLGGPGDLGVDLRCKDAKGRDVVVQCKRYKQSSRVCSDEMQKFIGMAFVHHRADKGIFITTSGFTRPAEQLGRRDHIRLINGDQLSRLVEQTQTRQYGSGRLLPLASLTLLGLAIAVWATLGLLVARRSSALAQPWCENITAQVPAATYRDLAAPASSGQSMDGMVSVSQTGWQSSIETMDIDAAMLAPNGTVALNLGRVVNKRWHLIASETGTYTLRLDNTSSDFSSKTIAVHWCIAD